jgi:oligo-1,6-glucosidase
MLDKTHVKSFKKMSMKKNVIWIVLLCSSFFESFGQDKAWWKETVVYQVYPQSFKDSDGDGVGDLKGIMQKLDYLQQLGIETIWINPFYKSPGYDNGYDISDYRSIDPLYGSMKDFDALLSGMKKRKMHLVMDMVLNHTSDEHPWFKEARQSRANVFHDFYVWKQGKKDSVPNNWPSIFGGSAWKWNEQTQEYYLHTFYDRQPDLNWDNPKMRQELYKIMRFWLDKGVDGFRLDAISLISKNKAFPPMDYSKGIFAALNGNINNGPHLHEYLKEMNQQVFGKYNVYTVGEIYTDKDSAWEYIAPSRKELSAMLSFDILMLQNPDQVPLLKKTLDGWNAALQSREIWNTSVLTDHDFPRAVSRIGNDKQYRVQSAKMLATLLLTYRGTPFIYQGEELGMTNYPFKDIAEIKDITAHDQFAALTKQQGLSDSAAFKIISSTTRDNARTPFQWDASGNAGFTRAANPWLAVNPNYIDINAAAERTDTGSILNYYKKLIYLRKTNPSLIYGSFEDIDPGDSSVFAFTRTLGKEKWLVILNMKGKAISYQAEKPGTVILSNYSSGKGTDPSLFQPYEARIYYGSSR